jgi:hypothetical protein
MNKNSIQITKPVENFQKNGSGFIIDLKITHGDLVLLPKRIMGCQLPG